MLTHKGTQKINNAHFLLRPFSPDDAPDMYKNWASDDRVCRYLTWTPHPSPEFTRQLLELWCKEYANPSIYNWAIVLNGSAIGNISVVQINEKSERADLGYCLGHAFWNQGIMTQVVRNVIDYLFSEINFHRIGIAHAVKNPASGRVARKCGMIYEGTQREYYKNSAGEYLDLSNYGILKSDWEKTQHK